MTCLPPFTSAGHMVCETYVSCAGRHGGEELRRQELRRIGGVSGNRGGGSR